MPELPAESELEALRALVRIARLLERVSGDLSLAHYRVLAAISDGDERASRLATRLALGKPAVSAAVDALCRRGLVARCEVADDQPAWLRVVRGSWSSHCCSVRHRSSVRLLANL